MQLLQNISRCLGLPRAIAVAVERKGPPPPLQDAPNGGEERLQKLGRRQATVSSLQPGLLAQCPEVLLVLLEGVRVERLQKPREPGRHHDGPKAQSVARSHDARMDVYQSRVHRKHRLQAEHWRMPMILVVRPQRSRQRAEDKLHRLHVVPGALLPDQMNVSRAGRSQGTHLVSAEGRLVANENLRKIRLRVRTVAHQADMRKTSPFVPEVHPLDRLFCPCLSHRPSLSIASPRMPGAFLAEENGAFAIPLEQLDRSLVQVEAQQAVARRRPSRDEVPPLPHSARLRRTRFLPTP